MFSTTPTSTPTTMDGSSNNVNDDNDATTTTNVRRPKSLSSNLLFNTTNNDAKTNNLRRIMNRRNDQTIQIRKERKENILRRRRCNYGTTSGDGNQPNDNGMTIENNDSNNVDYDTSQLAILLKQRFDEYVQYHHERQQQRQQQQSAMNEKQRYVLLCQLNDAFQSCTNNNNNDNSKEEGGIVVLRTFLEQLLETASSNDNNSSLVRLFVSHLLQDCNHYRTCRDPQINTSSNAFDDKITTVALSIILQISSINTKSINSSRTMNSYDIDNNDNTNEPEYNATTTDTSYYGHGTLKWTDLLLEKQPNGFNNLVSILLDVLTVASSIATIGNSNSIDSTIVLREMACHVLGNLIQDDTSISSTSLLSVLVEPYYWKLLVSNLPYSSYCCAAILRIDKKHYGMEFCTAVNENTDNDNNILKHEYICQLLENPKTSIDAVWILDGLCQREDDVIDYLLLPDGMILPTFIQRFHQEVTVATTSSSSLSSSPLSSSYEFIIPSLRTIGNICKACEGKYVYQLLSFMQPYSLFVHAMSRLLELPTSSGMRVNNYKNNDTAIRNKLFIEAAYVAGCLLTDAGYPDHPSTIIAVPYCMAPLVKVLIGSNNSSTNFECKLASLRAIANAISIPPPNPYLQSVLYSTPPYIRGTLDNIAGSLIWDIGKHQQGHDDDGDDNCINLDTSMNVVVMQALVDLLKLDNSDAVLTCMQIIDRLLRLNINDTSVQALIRTTFEECGGVDALEHIGDVFPSTNPESLLAANLIDDLFDDDDDGDNDYNGNSNNNTMMMDTAPAIQNNEFLFGIPGQRRDRPLAAALMLSTMPVIGRGRGRPMPAWMTQTQPRR